MDPTERFSDRAAAYARGRPGYPARMAPTVLAELGLGEDAVVADLGSGTGLSSEPFLRAGLRVIGIEPNAAMRAGSERHLAAEPRFRTLPGTAEATGLPPGSVDLVIAAQAFHWFDVVAARAEALRILRRPARAAVIWNERLATGSPFAEGYERLLRESCPDYPAIHGRQGDPARLAAFFGGQGWRRLTFANPSELDFDLLVDRLQSASYTPAPGSAGHAALLARLERLFALNERGGHVTMEHETRVHLGSLAEPSEPSE